MIEEYTAPVEDAEYENLSAEYWENKFLMLSNEHKNLQQLVDRMNNQIEDISITLEVANERWVKQVNENTSLEVSLRKLNKKA